MPKKIYPASCGRPIYAGALFLSALLVLVLAANGWFASVAAASDAVVPGTEVIPTRASPFDCDPNTTGSSAVRHECTSVAGVRWLPNSTLTLAYARGDFTDAERDAFHKAVSLWQRALAQTNVGIVLQESGEIDRDIEPARSQIIVKRDHSMDSRYYGKILATARLDNYVERATILINGSLHKQSSLRKTLLHELGHGFGLRDCPDCRSGSTVMNYFSQQSVMGFNIRKGNKISDQPTACDISQITNGYRQSPPPMPKDGEDESANTRTIVADEMAALPSAKSSNSDDNIIAPYLKPAAARKVNLLAVGPYLKPAPVPEANIHTIDTGVRKEGVLTDGEKTELESSLPTLLNTEAGTMEELNSYTFKRDVLIQTIDSKGRVSGEYHRVSDMLFDDSGARIERGLSLSKPTLRRLKVSPEYIEDFSGAQLKGFELSKRDHYRIEPFMTDIIDGLGMRVYRITPLNLNAARAAQARVFYGFAWVDEKTGKIIKIKGCALPDDKQRYPMFETQREVIDGEHFFPARTIADDYLVFPSHTVHIRMLITYSDYKRFSSRVKIIEVEN